MLPAWTQVVLGIAAVVTALGVLWSKVLKPGARLISSTEEMLPLLRNLTTTFKDTPDAFRTLNQIATQLAGVDLAEKLDRIEAMGLENREQMEAAACELRASDQNLRIGVETARQLADQDRETNRQLMLHVDRLATKIDEIIANGVRVALAREQIAENLTARESFVDEIHERVADELAARELHVDANTDEIAGNLADDKRRADESLGVPGEAADAAMTSPAAERRRVRKEAEEARRAKWDQAHARDEQDATDEADSTGGTTTEGNEEG